MSIPKALLLVFSDPGTDIPEAEYHDWYDNEHIPLRVQIPAFKSWARAEQSDGEQPRWAAFFDVDSVQDLYRPPYSELPKTRSDRENDIWSKLAVIDRRFYEEYAGLHPGLPPSAEFDPRQPGRHLVFVSNEVAPGAEEEYNKWYDEEHIPLLAKAPGWVRSRRFVLRDAQKTGTAVKSAQEKPPKYLAIHEWASEARKGSEEYDRAMSTAWRAAVMQHVTRRERREFTLYRAWTRTEESGVTSV
ncbi:hypothetical protein BC834DRAFT_882200 [Gloeopeniophorella convolvens]|nr:hypothetical protein BC834DRAFT_882200 [Gloeopeniophorella convolvens]